MHLGEALRQCRHALVGESQEMPMPHFGVVLGVADWTAALRPDFFFRAASANGVVARAAGALYYL